MKDKKNEMLISFEHLPKDERWQACLKALERDYTLTTKDICKMLKCSRSWFMKYIKPHVHYIYLANGKGQSSGANFLLAANQKLKREATETTWYSKSEFFDLLKKSIRSITRQTIWVPVEQLLDPEKKSYFESLYVPAKEIAKIEDVEKRDSMYEKNEKLLLDCVKAKYVKAIKDRPNRLKRSDTQQVPCTCADLDFKQLQAVHDLKDYGDTDEVVYRTLFHEGYVKIVIGIPDASGAESEKVFYYHSTDGFDPEKTKDFVYIKYQYYVSD